MILIKNFFTILVFIILLINNADAQIFEANSQLNYELKVMNASNDSIKNIHILEKAIFLKSIVNYTYAQQTLLRIDDSYFTDSVKVVFLYNKIFCAFMLSKYKEALFELPTIQQFKSRFYTNDMYLLELLVLAVNHKTNEFKESYFYYANTINYVDTSFVKNYVFEKSTDTETILTKIGKVFPGIDLVKNGFKKQGYVNIALMTLSVGNIVFQSFTGMYSFAICTGIYPFFKFKLGGKILLAHLPFNKHDKKVSNDILFMQNEIKKMLKK